MNYEKLYNTLYKEGYHIKELTNIGRKLVDHLTEAYDFNSILDVGCSNGLAVRAYLNKGKDAHGVDISKIAIEKAMELGIKNCRQGSVIELPHEDNFVDAIVSSDVLEHLVYDDIGKAVNELIRVTKKYLFLKIAPCKEGNREWIDLLHKKYEEFNDIENLHTAVYPLKDWIRFFESTGKAKFIKKDQKILVFEKI